MLGRGFEPEPLTCRLHCATRVSRVAQWNRQDNDLHSGQVRIPGLPYRFCSFLKKNLLRAPLRHAGNRHFGTVFPISIAVGIPNTIGRCLRTSLAVRPPIQPTVRKISNLVCEILPYFEAFLPLSCSLKERASFRVGDDDYDDDRAREWIEERVVSKDNAFVSQVFSGFFFEDDIFCRLRT